MTNKPDLTIEIVPIDKLTPDPQNARKHSKKNLDAIASSLKEFGQRRPLVVTKDYVVAAGNGTLEAAKHLGWTEIAVSVAPFDDPDRVKAYAIADNRTAELAEWDNEVLLEQLGDLELNGWSLEALGFDGKKPDGEDDTTPQDIAEKYEVVVECKDEDEQASLLLRLSAEGLKVRAIVL